MRTRRRSGSIGGMGIFADALKPRLFDLVMRGMDDLRA
jgi:hypothetical protein